MSDFTNEIKRKYEEQTESKSVSPISYDDVDLSVLLSFEAVQSEGEPDLIVELIDLYLEEVPQQLSAMKNFVLNADADSLKRAAHNLKGSSANLGVNTVAALCEELEQADLSESFQQSNTLTSQMEQAFARVRTTFLAQRQNRA